MGGDGREGGREENGRKGEREERGRKGGRKEEKGRKRKGGSKENETIGACVTYVKILVEALAMVVVSHGAETMFFSDGSHCISERCLITPQVFS